MAASTRARRSVVISGVVGSTCDADLAPNSKSTSKRKRGKELNSRELPLFSISAVDGGAACTWKAVAQSSANKKRKASAINLKTAITVVCRSTLLKSPAASRAALAKHRAFIDPALAEILEIVGKYPDEACRTSLHQSGQCGDAVIVQTLIAAGADMSVKDTNGATPLDLATDDACCAILEHHAAVLATIKKNPTALISAATAHCAALSASEESVLTAALPLHEYQLGSSFLWATPAARTTVFAWARDAFIAQIAANTQPFEELSDDCAGDVLEFLDTTMARAEILHVATHCSSTEAHAWLHEVLAAAITANATIDLGPAVHEGDLPAVQDCLAKGANVDALHTEHERTALMYASYHGHTDIVKLLLKAGADTDLSNRCGYTALISAVDKGHADTVKLLLKAGAEMEAMNVDGYTALLTAKGLKRTEIVKLLLETGAETKRKVGQGDPQWVCGIQDAPISFGLADC